MRSLLRHVLLTTLLGCLTHAHAAVSNVWSLEAPRPASWHVFTLHQPDRVVIDIQSPGVPQPSSKHPAWLHGVRTGRHPHHTRFVLLTSTPLRHQLTQRSGHDVMTFAPMVPPHRRTVQHVLPTHPLKPRPHQRARPPVQPSTPPRDVRVVIDPGHGGHDPGAIGYGGVREKDVVLSIGRALAKVINRTPGFQAWMTRKDDRYLTLRQRLNVARKHRPDCFVAIHADAYRVPGAHGLSVYALSQRGATSEAARWMAETENRSELMGGAQLHPTDPLLNAVLINLQQTATISASLSLGRFLLTQMSPWVTLHHERVEQAAFVVLKSPDIPSLLVETGFLSNPTEARHLRSPAYQRQLAQHIARALVAYFKTHPISNLPHH